jgi:hypothetical protein
MQAVRPKASHVKVNDDEEIQPLIIPPLLIEGSEVDEEMPN